MVKPHAKETSGATEKSALGWNPQGVRQRRLRKTWKRTVEKEANKDGKTWSEIQWLANNRKESKYFTAALCSTAKSDRIDGDHFKQLFFYLVLPKHTYLNTCT